MISYNDIIIQRNNTLKREIKYRPLRELKENISNTKIRADFKGAILDKKDVSIICEYKPASPSKGEISDLLVEDIIPLYDKCGARAISVLTEETFFKSNIKNMRIASKITTLPLLRKDFIIDEYQIYEARSCGASAVLLMANLYRDLQSGIDLCRYLGMDALVECKNREEIDIAAKAGADIIGINNRNFSDFSVDLKHTLKLAKYVPENVILVSESGVKKGEDIKLLATYGADAVLVGSSLMASPNMPQKIEEIVLAAKNARLD